MMCMIYYRKQNTILSQQNLLLDQCYAWLLSMQGTMLHSIKHTRWHWMDCTRVCLVCSLHVDQCSACTWTVIERRSDQYLYWLDSPDKISSTGSVLTVSVVIPEWFVSLVWRKVSFPTAESHTVHLLTKVGPPPSSQMIRWRTRRASCEVCCCFFSLLPFVTTSRVLGQLVRGTCPRPCLLCLATA